MKELSQRKRGRPAKNDLVGIYVDFDGHYGRLVKSARERKGLGPKQYLQTLIHIGDKHIPTPVKPRITAAGITFTAYPLKK